MAKILVVDDDAQFLQATSELLQLLGHDICTAASVAEAQTQIRATNFSHVMLDLILPDGSGLHILNELLSAKSAACIALVTGHASIKSLVMDLHGPNIQYLIKPIDLSQLKSFIEKPERDAGNTQKVPVHFGHLVGESAAMQRLYELINRVAKTSANVMLIGESGSGKEEVAASIHVASGASGKFIPVNCGALNAELISSELFGHEKGAFTGAVARKPGVFELAESGTLFLDEITEMPLDLQPNLLRVLESRKVTRLGATSSSEVSCRVVSASNRSETNIVEENRLREDLYFRLAVFPIQVPPLRARKDDIPLLVQYFLHDLNRQYGAEIGIDDADVERLREYDWPGNVRELRHCLHRAYIMADHKTQLLRLPERIESPFAKSEGSSMGIRFGKTVEEVERELIQATLVHLNGDKKQAAEMLGISLKTLYNRLNSYEATEASSL